VPAPVELLVAEVSFISLKLVLPAALALCAASAELVVLVKPQFEAGRAHLKKGIVRDEAVQKAVCADIERFYRGRALARHRRDAFADRGRRGKSRIPDRSAAWLTSAL